jgi:FixJ family two-component response regulator
MDRPTVFVVDDEFAVRDALKLFLESSGLAVETFDSARSFLEGCRPDWSGCLVLDIRMPGMSGLELQQTLKARQIPIPIIFLTGHGDVPMAAKAFKSGAVDFIEKPFNDQELLDGIREALERDARARTHKDWEGAARERYVHLTRREKEVMALVVAGRSNKEIARDLDVSHRTIDVHRARVMEKMRAQSLPELVNMAVACGVSP